MRKMLFIAFVLGLFVAAPCLGSEGEWVELAKFHKKAKGFVIGDIQKVLAGNVAPADMVRLKLPGVLLGVGYGSFSDEKEMGDMAVVSRKAFIRSPNPFRNFATEAQSHLAFTPYLVGLRADESADAIFHYRPAETTYWAKLYSDLAALYPNGYLLVGMGDFSYLKGSSLKLPPISGEKISGENAAKYFQPSDVWTDARCVFIAVFANGEKMKERVEPAILQRAFYQAVDGKSWTNLSQAAFVLSGLTGPLPEPRTQEEFLLRAKGANLSEVRHLLATSKLKEAVILVYDLREIGEYAE